MAIPTPDRRDVPVDVSVLNADQLALFVLLAQVRRLMSQAYPDHDPYLVAYPRKSSGRVLRLLCPELFPTPVPCDAPADGTNADLILTVLDEADRPLTVVELAYKATGGEPTGAFRKAVRKLVASGEVAEHAGPPKSYERG